MKTVEELSAYIKKLCSVLYQWQLSLNNTKFLGSAAGHLTISTVAPAPTDGYDEDLWIKV